MSTNAVPFVGDPVSFVEHLPIATLAEATAGEGCLDFVILDDGSIRFRCPQCRYTDHNGGTAVVIDGWRWTCRRCARTWTRYRLERIVLEDAETLDRAYRIVEAERVA